MSTTTINDNPGVCEEECPRFQVLAGLNDQDVGFLKSELGIFSDDGLIDLEPDDIQDDEIRPIKKRRLLKTAKYLSLGYSIESDTTLRHIHNVAKAGIEARSETSSSSPVAPASPRSGIVSPSTSSMNQQTPPHHAVYFEGVGLGLNQETPYVYFEGVQVPDHVKFVITDRSAETVKVKALFEHPNVQRFVVTKNVTTMECRALARCNKLKNVIFEDRSSLRHVEEGVFRECPMIEEINLPACLETLGGLAFWACKRLKKVTLSPKMREIKVHTFGVCSSLTTVKGMNAIQHIGQYAFAYCSSLETIDVNKNALIDADAFNHGFNTVINRI